MAGFAPGLAPIAARPPTPPKENNAKTSPGNGFMTFPASHATPNTPDESPSSSAECSKDSSGKLQKKVGFTFLGTQYHRFSVDGHESDSDGQIRQLPRSRDCKSSKSILKVCTDNAEDHLKDQLLALDHTNLPAMLRSTTQHLASASRSSRLDAYSTLLACLSAYDEVPEVQEMAEEMAEILGYVRRDVTAHNEKDGSLDIQIATQALKLVTVFLCTPSIANLFPEDFCSFILERSISSLEDQACPKTLLSHYMHLLGRQKFSSKYMTPDRVNRLISALDTVTTRVTGNRIVGHRLMLYHRLLGQTKSSMISRVGSWIDHLVSGMLSTIKDSRARAIAFGFDASLQLGTTSSVSQACLDVFNRSGADGRKVADFLCSRLIEMANIEEDSIHVPQIWSVVVLFLRSRRRQLENWEHLKAWLVVIQRCFNCGDGQTKLQANIAWNRFIFAINLDTSTSNSMAKMLKQPIVSPLEQRSGNKNARSAKQIARSSYCTLLYYALRPTATHAQLDLYWNLYVDQILPSCLTANKVDINHACNIMSALFSGNGKSKTWEDTRTFDGPINPEDLPCLDPKWVRLRAAGIMLIFDKLFDTADWQLYENGDAPIVLAWRAFASALGNAGGKEVKISTDTMSAVAHIINEIKLLLERSNSRFVKERQVLTENVTSRAGQSEIFEKVTILINEAVAKLGHIPFLERRLIRTSHDSLEAADTPSSRSSRTSGSLDSPVAHLLNVLLRNAQQTFDASSYIGTLKTVLNISLQSAGSRRAQLSTLRNLSRLLTSDGAHQKENSIILWRVVAESASWALKQSQQHDTHNDSPQYPGHEYREAVKLLELGIQFRSSSNRSTWHELFTSIVDTLQKDIGKAAISPVMIEPLTGSINKSDNMCNDFILAAVTSMLETAQWPQSQHSIEQIERRLWGVTYGAPKVTSSNSIDKFHSMIGSLLSSAYASLELLPLATVVAFISATAKMIASCTLDYIGMVLLRIQKGLAPWIEDKKGILSLRSSSPFRVLSPEVRKLWVEAMKSIEQSTVFDTRYLLSIQDLVVAGFKSRHRAIVNGTIVMWKNTFARDDALEYPKDLRAILQKLRSKIDLRLPNFPESTDDEVMYSPLNFIDSQDEEEIQPESRVSPTEPPMSLRSLQDITGSNKCVPLSPDSRKVAGPQSSPASSRRTVKATPKARLRHDDSQIQFAAIESSPLQPTAESQNLTAHQKEVKERQGQEAAAMFPEIRSSSRSNSRPSEYVLPKLVFKSSENQSSESAFDEGTSPTFLPDALMNDYLGSSPTPSSKRSNERRPDDDPPASPPFVPFQFPVTQSGDEPLAREISALSQAKATTEVHPNGNLVDEQMPSRKDYTPDRGSIMAVDNDQRPLNGPEHTSNLQVPQRTFGPDPVSDLDVYVDAPSEPALNIPSTEHGDDQPADIAASFQSQGSSQFSIEDEQITAQLITEMDYASSQQLARKTELAQSARGATKKRKNTASSSNQQKRTKRASAPLVSQATVEVPGTGETVVDCVMIKVRETDTAHTVSPRKIKRERSASPSILSSQVVEEIPLTERRHVNHSINSKADQSSGQGNNTPTTARKAIGRARPSRSSQANLEESEKERSSTPRKITRASERLSGSKAASPRVTPVASQESTKGRRWSGLGKTPRRGMFRWLHSSVDESEDQGTSKQPISSGHEKNTEDIGEQTNVPDSQGNAVSPADQQPEDPMTRHNGDEVLVAERCIDETKDEGREIAERTEEAASAQGIIQNFRGMLENIKRVTFGREEERAVVGMLFECIKEVHEAGRRHTDG